MNYIRIDSLNVGDYKKCSANGEGIRVILWCAGCDLHCEGCHNSDWWNFDCGKPFNEEAMEILLKEISHPLIDGLTLLGGEPTADANIDTEIKIAKKVKEKFSDKNIWLYSGHKLEELLKNEKAKQLLTYCDVVVDGRFIESKRNITLKFRGSTNQIIWEKKDDKWVKSELN